MKIRTYFAIHRRKETNTHFNMVGINNIFPMYIKMYVCILKQRVQVHNPVNTSYNSINYTQCTCENIK